MLKLENAAEGDGTASRSGRAPQLVGQPSNGIYFGERMYREQRFRDCGVVPRCSGASPPLHCVVGKENIICSDRWEWPSC